MCVMDETISSQTEATLSSRFQKYGIEILENGFINGPKKPSLNGRTPELSFENSIEAVLDSNREFLYEYFLHPFSVAEHQTVVLEVVDKIFREITGKSFKDFSNIIIMSKDDFIDFKNLVAAPGLKEQRGIQGDFHGISLGGLLILQDTGGNSCFPLLFHELGHNLYPDEHNNYTDEFRAFYFQILCTKKLEQELKKIGIEASYPDDHYEGLPLPTEDHRKAFMGARVLFIYQTQYEMVVKGSSRAEAMMDEFLEIVKQKRKVFI